MGADANRKLDEIVDLYLTLRRLSPGATYLLRRSVVLFGKWLGRSSTVADLTDESVSRWLENLEQTHSAQTRAGHRTRILGLWKLAARRGWCDPPGEVRAAPIPEPMPDSWTELEVGRLVAACDKLAEGKAWFKATVLVGYESGLRRGDMRAIPRDSINPDTGQIVLRMKKTAWPHVVQLSLETAKLVLSLPGAYPLACPWGSVKYGRLWAILRKIAGVGDKGGCQQLRRTGATLVARDQGLQAAREFLGHKTGNMVFRYVNKRIAVPPVRRPPKIISAAE